MQTVESSLSILNLDALPDEVTLKRRFRKAMLAVHPDRNPQKRDWAEEKTRELIQAYEILSERLQSGASVDYDESFHVKSNAAEGSPEQYQVVVTAEARYSMPLRWMKSAVRFEDVIQKRGFHGAMIVYNNRMYPVFSVRGRSATARPGQALVLFEWPGGRAAMVMAHSVERFYTMEIDYREIFWSRKSDGTVRMLRGGQTLLFPAFLLPAMQSENNISSEADLRSGMPF